MNRYISKIAMLGQVIRSFNGEKHMCHVNGTSNRTCRKNDHWPRQYEGNHYHMDMKQNSNKPNSWEHLDMHPNSIDGIAYTILWSFIHVKHQIT